MRYFRPLPLIVLTLAPLTACDESNPAGPDGPDLTTLTVDAAEDWAFVALEDGEASGVTVEDASSSEAWDLAFFATSVMLNGGAAGPAGVVGHCLCENANASDAQVMAMTPESQLESFETVTEAQIPSSEDAWQSDALDPAIEGWYAYDPSTHTVSAAPESAWKVRTASGEAFVKFHVTELEGATQSHAGSVTFEYALQEAAGAAFGPVTSHTVDVSAGPVHFDLETGAEVTATDEWDLRFEGYAIRVNGGVSGDADAGAVLSDESFDAMTDASDAPARVYAADAFGGVFDAHPWYRYNLEGNHQVWPTYDVYLVSRGDAVYKVQLTGYYDQAGESRQITFRYAQLR